MFTGELHQPRRGSCKWILFSRITKSCNPNTTTSIDTWCPIEMDIDHPMSGPYTHPTHSHTEIYYCSHLSSGITEFQIPSSNEKLIRVKQITGRWSTAPAEATTWTDTLTHPDIDTPTHPHTHSHTHWSVVPNRKQNWWNFQQFPSDDPRAAPGRKHADVRNAQNADAYYTRRRVPLPTRRL